MNLVNLIVLTFTGDIEYLTFPNIEHSISSFNVKTVIAFEIYMTFICWEKFLVYTLYIILNILATPESSWCKKSPICFFFLHSKQRSKLNILSYFRYMAIIHPLRRRPTQRVVLAIITIWIVSITLSVPYLLYGKVITYQNITKTTCGLVWPDGQFTESKIDFWFV